MQNDDANFACLLLNMCPSAWVDQYNLVEKYMPQDTRNMLPQLEALEKVDPGKSLVENLSGHKKEGNH